MSSLVPRWASFLLGLYGKVSMGLYGANDSTAVILCDSAQRCRTPEYYRTGRSSPYMSILQLANLRNLSKIVFSPREKAFPGTNLK
jgi:hypothetical protein